MENNSNRKTEAALNSLSGIEKAMVPEYFFTRLEARMRNERQGFLEKIYYSISRPSIALAAIFLLLFVNIVILFWSGAAMPNEQPEIASVDEYNMVSSTYEIENLIP